MSFTAYCLTCRQFGCICTPIGDNTSLFKELRQINAELDLMAKYIYDSPVEVIADTLWFSETETMHDALIRLSGQLSALVPPNTAVSGLPPEQQ